MFDFVPKFHHMMVSAFISIGFIALGAVTRGRVLIACNIGAGFFMLVALVVLFMFALESLNRRVRVMTDWMEQFVKLDDEGRAAVAFAFPTMRYRMRRGEVRSMFEDTNVPIEIFRLFLQTSNDQQISPRRDWHTADQPEWAWLEIQGWLQENDYILPDSAAGSHSWLWRGNAYRHLFAYWMAGRKIADMSERVYAYDLPTSPLEETSSGGPK